MSGRTHQRELLRQLADRLIVEYSGSVPPGQVLAAVFRANHALSPSIDLTVSTRLRSCESLVRQTLARRFAPEHRTRERIAS
jgi:hypothetical protein